MSVWLSFVDYGVANRYSYNGWDEIEVNKDLTKNWGLYNNIIKHEIKHLPGGFTFYDFKHDINDGISKRGLYKWMLRHPKSWLQLSPIWYTKQKGIIIDINSIIMWTIILTIIGGIIWSL